MSRLLPGILSLTRTERYGIALMSVLLTGVLRWMLDPLLVEDLPLFLFILPVILTCWFGGLAPGLLATLFLLLLGDYLFMTPRGALFQYEALSLPRASVLAFAGIALSFLIDGTRKAIAKITRDLTEHQRAEDALRAGEQFASRIMDVSPSVIYIYDVGQKRNVFSNRRVAAALGYFHKPEMEDAEFLQSVMHPDSWQRFLDYLAGFDNLPNDAATEFEYCMRHASGDWRWFHSRDKVFTRNADGSVKEIIGTATDITERKNAEDKVRFLGDLNEAFQPLADPDEIMAVAVRMLGEHLGVDRCGYAEVEADANTFVVKGNYTRGATASIVGRYCMSDFGDNERQVLLENRLYVVNDIEAESPAGTDLSLYRQGGIRSMVCVPLSKGGKFMARMAVQQNTPRRWTSQEVQLITAVANRCWESVERARALRNLKESDERYRAFIANSSEAIWRFELEQPISLTLSEDEQLELLYRYAYLAECNDAMAHMYGYAGRDEILGVRLANLLLRSDSGNIAFLRAMKQAGYRLMDVETHEVDRYGNTKYLLNNIAGILENGAIVRVWGTQRDITTQKEAADALRASEERYRLLIELSPDGVVIADGNGTIHLANPSMLRMLGVTADRVIGRNLFDFLSPEFQDHCRTCMESVMTTQELTTRVDAAFQKDDGRKSPAEVNAIRFEWKGQRLAQIVIHDLTRRQEAEVERERLLGSIEAERNRLRQILEQMPIGVAVAEAPRGAMRFHNVEAVRLLRHPLLPSEDYAGLAQYGARHEDGSPYLAEEYPMARSLLSGAVIKGEEMNYRRGDGTDTVFSVDSAPIFDPEGRMVLTIATFIDIAKRKQSEEALRESEERFAKAFRATPDGLVISRMADGLILEVNDSFLLMSGYSRDEMIGKSTLSLGLYAHPADRERLLSIMKEKNYVRDFEFEMKRKSGEIRLIAFSAQPFNLRGEHCWLTIGRDITERKLAEDARLKSEEEARRHLAYVEAIYATAPVGLCFVDTDLRYRSINERLAEINGKSVEEHLGRTVREIVPELADMVEPHYRYVISSGEPVLNVETSAVGRTTGMRHYIVSYYPVRDGGGRVLGVNVVVMDITQRKQAEQERERLLLQEKAAREQAEAASRMKDEFLATISHELRTPLTSILGWARLLSGGSLSESQTQRAMRVIEQNAKSQARLVDDILDASRITTGRYKLEARPVEIGLVFQAAIDVIRPSAEAKRIVLQIKVEDRGSIVLGDANRLQQVIWNLLSNAIKFTDEGGTVEARIARFKNHIEITVSDTGMGIAADFLPFVFDPFRQADSTSTRRYGGLGLGLAIVRHVVELHGGSVSASSAGKGRGSTFKITLPIASSKPILPGRIKPEPASNLEPSQKLNGLRVLVVEDDPDTLDMIRFVLDKSGAEVITVKSTNEALQTLDRLHPDALVSDLAMPGLDGYELIVQVRSRGPQQGGNVPAIALSAYTGAEDRLRALAAGFQIHVPKPVDPEELVDVVASLTSSRP